MLRPWKKLTSAWNCLEAGSLGEVKVEWEVLILVGDSEAVVFPLIACTLTKL